MVTLQFMGGGRMAEALVAGLLADARRAPGDLRVVEVSEQRRAYLAGEFPGLEVASEVSDCEGLVVATKPDAVVEALRAAGSHRVGRVLSIAAGVATATIEAALGGGRDVAVIRAMPNTPALVGRGATAICGGSSAAEEDLEWAEALLGAVGVVERVPESLMDAVTGLSGSGPAYVFLVAEALVEAGVLNGLPRDTATRLATQTLLGAATLLSRSDQGAEELRAMVTSPGGTTAEALSVLEDRGVRSAFMAAVSAAARRSAELG